jgi:ribosomal protein S12 methylthiotransferase accessory factor YcaO
MGVLVAFMIGKSMVSAPAAPVVVIRTPIECHQAIDADQVFLKQVAIAFGAYRDSNFALYNSTLEALQAKVPEINALRDACRAHY